MCSDLFALCELLILASSVCGINVPIYLRVDVGLAVCVVVACGSDHAWCDQNHRNPSYD